MALTLTYILGVPEHFRFELLYSPQTLLEWSNLYKHWTGQLHLYLQAWLYWGEV